MALLQCARQAWRLLPLTKSIPLPMELSEYSPYLSRQLQPFSSPSPSEEPVLDVFRDVVSAIEDEVTQYREAFTQSFVDTARERCPHMNALAICTPHAAFLNTRRRIYPSSTPRFLAPVMSSRPELSLAAATAVLRTSASQVPTRDLKRHLFLPYPVFVTPQIHIQVLHPRIPIPQYTSAPS